MVLKMSKHSYKVLRSGQNFMISKQIDQRVLRLYHNNTLTDYEMNELNNQTSDLKERPKIIRVCGRRL